MTDVATSDTREQIRIGRMSVGTVVGGKSSGWWGMMTLILTEGFLFLYLLFSYYYFAVTHGRAWMPHQLPSFKLSGPNTVILLLSSVAAWYGESGIRRGNAVRATVGLLLAIVLGATFMGVQLKEWADKPFTLSSDAYGSMYFTITGFHMAHVAAGLLILFALAVWSALGYFDRQRFAPVTIGTYYWHFVDAVWLAVFFTFYITPYLS